MCLPMFFFACVNQHNRCAMPNILQRHRQALQDQQTHGRRQRCPGPRDPKNFTKHRTNWKTEGKPHRKTQWKSPWNTKINDLLMGSVEVGEWLIAEPQAQFRGRRPEEWLASPLTVLTVGMLGLECQLPTPQSLACEGAMLQMMVPCPQ